MGNSGYGTGRDEKSALSLNVKAYQVTEKVIFVRVLKNTQMLGTRIHEE